MICEMSRAKSSQLINMPSATAAGSGASVAGRPGPYSQDGQETSTDPAVSIVVPCRNEGEYVANFVRSVLSQEPVPGGFEVIVADGASDDGTRGILRALSGSDGRLRVIDNPSRTVSAGLNAAIRQARGSVIVRMDVHTAYAPDYVKRCVEVLDATGADNVGGPWVARGQGAVGRAVAAAFNSPFASGNARGHKVEYEGPIDTVYLGCWPRRVFDTVGYFDEELVRNQDDEFNLRLWRAGGRIWQSPAIRSWYVPRSSLPALCRQYLQYGYWKVRVIQKHARPASVRHVVPAAFVLTVMTLAPASLIVPLAGWLLLSVLAAYLVLVLGASSQTAARHGWRLAPILPLVFAAFHLSYGLGSLHGIIDFGLLRRTGSHRHSRLTRGVRLRPERPAASGEQG